MSNELSEAEVVPAVPGFRFAGISAGIKANGKPDLALAVADSPAAMAAVFTRNLVCAAPVDLARERARAGKLRAILVNSGNANACTGAPGRRAAESACEGVARAIGCAAEEIIPASTGVIGALLPAEKITSAAGRLVSTLSEDGAGDFARAIMTTDQWRKVAIARPIIDRKECIVVGVAKGAGMIHPDMATTLGFVFTDASAPPAALRRILRSAVDATFNAISVDGDTSTNDTIVLAASGATVRVKAGSTGEKRLAAAVHDVLALLGESIVRDGEGARHVVRLEVRGLATDEAAKKVAKTIATSPLVKTAIHGRDANWGRILAAAGRAGVRFDPSRAEIAVGDTTIVRQGMPVGKEAEAEAAKTMAGPKYTIRVTLGKARGKAHYLTCDLGTEYIAVNANYRS